MPVGHPTILLNPTYHPNKYYGFIKCTILPPRNLYHPVLPYRSQNRLLFPLCRTCADSRQNTLCRHNVKERALTGAWITPEVDKAIEKGYQLIECFEVWNFETTAEYNNGTEQYPQGLFGTYVDANLKIKQEASGWPTNVITKEERDKFIADYKQKEGKCLCVRNNNGN